MLWQKATFVFDTNMLLNIYRYQGKTREKFFEVLEQLKARIWTPHQAIYEYQNNRLEVISQQIKVYNEVSKALKDAQVLLEGLTYLKEKHSFINIGEIIDAPVQALGKANAELSENQRSARQEITNLKQFDIYREKIAQLFKGRIGEPYKKDQLVDLYFQADKRFELQIPPGWKDKGKKTFGKYGDVILWFQLLDYARAHHKPIILVTDDVKSDWFLSAQENNGYIQPRSELVQEMFVEAHVLFHAYQGYEFFKQATKFLELTLEPDISADAKEVTAQNTGVYHTGVLITSLSNQPVKVSSMYDLLKEKENLNIDRVTVLVPSNDEAQYAYYLVQEALHDSKELHLDLELLEYDNVDSWQNACIFLQRLYSLLDNHQKSDRSVYLSLAGCGKSMAALMAWVAPFFPCIKKLYDVINKEEEYTYSAFDLLSASSLTRSRLMHPNLDQLSLVEIPFEQEQQISEKLRLQLLVSQSEDFEEAEALITAQTIFQQDHILNLNITKKVIEQLHDIYNYNVVDAQVVRNGLLRMGSITTLRDPGIGVDTYSFRAAEFSRITLRYFTGLEAPIRPVFYTLPVDSDDQIERIVICSLEVAGADGYRTLKEVATSPGFSFKDLYNIDKLPLVPSPVESVLIVPLGKSPMVATQLYTLLTRQEKRLIREVVLIYPQRSAEIINGAKLIKKALHEEYEVPCTLVGIPGLEDITTTEDCQKSQIHLEAEIERVRQEYPPNCKIDLALSGGRKGMTAMTIFAAQKMRIPYVYHTVIADEELSNQISGETAIKDLLDPRVSKQERNDRLFLRAYTAEGPDPYAHFVLFRVPVFTADGW